MVTGSGAQNGIELGFGAKGTIKNNTVIDNLYVIPADASASNILLFDAASPLRSCTNAPLGTSLTRIASTTADA
jgi:hypothetical protein